MQYHFCTLSDERYLILGLTMYESMARYAKSDFILHYLAVGDEAACILRQLNLPNIQVYTLNDFQDDQEYQTLVANNKSVPGGESPFHYALSAFFLDHLFTKQELYHCLYVDADILFYSDPCDIIDRTVLCSVGLVTHKHIPMNKTVRNPGYYNVGIIYFTADATGMKCLKWWKSCVVNPSNKYSKIFGSCGDQKYLELFENVIGCDRILVLDRLVGHAAPWNVWMMAIDVNNERIRVRWHDPEHLVLAEDYLDQELKYFHFSHFLPDYSKDQYRVAWGREWGNIAAHPGVVSVYNDYYTKCKATKLKYSL